VPTNDTPLIITILPALPSQWPSGHLRGARVRKGITVDIEWSNGKPTSVVLAADQQANPFPVEVVFGGESVQSYTTTPGESETITDF
jgi:alpha-L-fucosidase 2